MPQVITLNAGATNQTSVTLVPMPLKPGLKTIEPGAFDAVSTNVSPWTGQTQRQYWPGGDRWMAKCTLPPMMGAAIDEWEAWALGMFGMLNAVQLGYPNKRSPRGSAAVAGVGGAVVDGTVTTNNGYGARSLVTKGWLPNASGVLLKNDALQVGYRYYRVLDDVDADGSGGAVLPVWPSLREKPADGTALVLSNPVALFGLAQNRRTWGLRLPMIMDYSFDLVEWV